MYSQPNISANSFKNPAYRFGFNGKEKDQQGEFGLTAYDYGFRIYNPAIGKFLSVDPLFKEYPAYSTYQFAGNKPIVAIDIDGLEEMVKIYDYSVNYKKPTIQVVDYSETKSGHGPLGTGVLNIHKYKNRDTRISYFDADPQKTFFTTINPEDFVEPPAKINDDPTWKVESVIKLGAFAEAGLKFGGQSLKVEGGAYQEFLKSEWSERGIESTESIGQLKGSLGLGPVTFETNPYSGDNSLEIGTHKMKDKHTFNMNTRDYSHTSTLTGEEDIPIFSIKAGAYLGGEISVSKNNPIRKIPTKKWHGFLNDVKNNQLEGVK